MTTLATVLTFDHRRCDELFAAAEEAASHHDLATAAQRFEEFRRVTERHFRIEEETLFPAFEDATGLRGGGGPTAVMREEHSMMRGLFDEMGQALAQGEGERYLSQSETLLVLMQQHNLKEERMLYPLADRALGPKAEDLLADIETALHQE
jgi:hemerythrin-like domain-containing protein